MKSKFIRVGKRSLSIILTLMMIVSTMLVGMVTTNASGGIAEDKIVYLIPSDCGWDSYLNDNYTLKVYYKHNDDADKTDKQGLATMTLYSKTINSKAVYTATIQDWWNGLSYLHFRVYDSSDNKVAEKQYTNKSWKEASNYANKVYNGSSFSVPVWDSDSGDTKTNYYLRGTYNDWKTGIQMDQSSDNTYAYTKVTGNGTFKICNDADKWDCSEKYGG